MYIDHPDMGLSHKTAALTKRLRRHILDRTSNFERTVSFSCTLRLSSSFLISTFKYISLPLQRLRETERGDNSMDQNSSWAGQALGRNLDIEL